MRQDNCHATASQSSGCCMQQAVLRHTQICSIRPVVRIDNTVRAKARVLFPLSTHTHLLPAHTHTHTHTSIERERLLNACWRLFKKLSFIRCCYAPAQSCAPPLLCRVTVVLSETITTTRGNKSAQASEMLPLKLKCRNAAASAAASSAAPTAASAAAYACSSFVCRPVVCLLPRSVRSCLNYDIVIIKWMHGATAATSAEAAAAAFAASVW